METMEYTNNYTKLPNELIEILLSDALSKNEARILLMIARKTFGFHKETDRISTSQFVDRLSLSRRGVQYILSRLQQAKLIALVNKGNSRFASSEWKITIDNYPEKLVKLSALVKFQPQHRDRLAKHNDISLAQHASHTKESYTKEKPNLTENTSSKHQAWALYSTPYLEKLGIEDPHFIAKVKREYLKKATFETQNAVREFIDKQRELTPPDLNYVDMNKIFEVEEGLHG
jgi:phage replication O-like protein O